MDLAIRGFDELVAAAKAKGHMGIAIVQQGSGQYLALCVGQDGRVCDPRSWVTHTAITGALGDLAERMK